MRTEKQIISIIALLEGEYPNAKCSLDYIKDYELLFSTRLAAQCTDERVNKISPALFAKYPSLTAFAAADISELETLIHSCGFFRSKARDIIACANMLISDYGGAVPDTMDELLTLPGVGRKTANLILGDIYGKPAVVTDTHCIRLSNRLGFVENEKNPARVEAALRACLPPEKASDFCHRLVLHGRAVCTARRANCESCVLAAHCREYGP